MSTFPHAEGYVKNNANNYVYHYIYKDHLGNNRLVYADLNNNGTIELATEIIEENNYYPFGLKHKGYNELAGNGYKYKYLNREYEDSFGLNVIETDFRQYDAALGRFNVMDALSELAPNYTPYRYGFNNPVFWQDATGLFETYGQAMKFLEDNNLNGKINFYDANDWSKGFVVTVIGGEFDGQVFYAFYSELKSLNGDGGGSNSGSNKNGMPGDAVPCVQCHHTTIIPNGERIGDIVGGTGGLKIWGIGTEDMGNADIDGRAKHINVTDLPGFTGPGQNLAQKVTEGLTKLASLNEDSNIRSWILNKNNDPYVTHSTKRFFIAGQPVYSDYVEIYGMSYDTVIKNSMKSKVDRKKEADSIRLLPLRNNYNDSIRNARR